MIKHVIGWKRLNNLKPAKLNFFMKEISMPEVSSIIIINRKIIFIT